MSQFILCTGNSQYFSSIKNIEVHYLKPEDFFLKEIAENLIPHYEKLSPWYISASNSDFDSLFVSAQNDLLDGRKFEDTSLGEFFFKQ